MIIETRYNSVLLTPCPDAFTTDMCGLFGFVHYGNEPFKNLSVLTNSLAEYSAVRGTDATGIAYLKNGNIQIQKEAKSAYAITCKHPDTITALIGHIRMQPMVMRRRILTIIPFSVKPAVHDLL